jgi:hypothetical protein
MIKATYTKSLTISVAPGQYEQVKEITDQKQISMSEWVRDAVDAALKNTKLEGVQVNDK